MLNSGSLLGRSLCRCCANGVLASIGCAENACLEKHCEHAFDMWKLNLKLISRLQAQPILCFLTKPTPIPSASWESSKDSPWTIDLSWYIYRILWVVISAQSISGLKRASMRRKAMNSRNSAGHSGRGFSVTKAFLVARGNKDQEVGVQCVQKTMHYVIRIQSSPLLPLDTREKCPLLGWGMQVRDGTVGSVHAYGSLRQAVLSTWHSEGLHGFFRGRIAAPSSLQFVIMQVRLKWCLAQVFSQMLLDPRLHGACRCHSTSSSRQWLMGILVGKELVSFHASEQRNVLCVQCCSTRILDCVPGKWAASADRKR